MPTEFDSSRDTVGGADVGLSEWLDEAVGEDRIIFVKRLAANDTLATKAHQAGPYLPKEAVSAVAPDLLQPGLVNPRKTFRAYTDSHPSEAREVNLIWYNHYKKEAKQEGHLTRWGGVRSPLLDPESTGSIAILSFSEPKTSGGDELRVWVCRGLEEDLFVESRFGRIEPGRGQLLPSRPKPDEESTEVPPADDFPTEWVKEFPTGREIAELAALRNPASKAPSLDLRLVRRREAETAVFTRLEELHALPLLKKPFESVKAFRAAALSFLQRAKSRSGNSLEHHVRLILDEERIPYSHPGKTEGKKKPDFLLPSNADYANPTFPFEHLRMLGAKTTLKDRWRQVLNEADRVKSKHLITLQEGVSVAQFKEMVAADLKLVVPKALHERYPKEIRSELMTLDGFVTECRALNWPPRGGGQSVLLLTGDP